MPDKEAEHEVMHAIAYACSRRPGIPRVNPSRQLIAINWLVRASLRWTGVRGAGQY
jgi:hypothetical protein